MIKTAKKVIFILFFIAVYCHLGYGAFADFGRWEEAFKVLSGKVLCIESVEETDALYIGSDEGLYKTENSGKNWKRILLPGGSFSVKDVAIAGEEIFIATDNGIYIGKEGDSLKLVPGKGHISGATIYNAQKKAVLVWQEDDLFKLSDGEWKRLGSRSLWRKGIDDAAFQNGVIFVASGGCIFHSLDGGNVWKKTTLLKINNYAEEIVEEIVTDSNFGGISDEKIDIERYSFIGNIDTHGHEGVTVATTNGIFSLRGEGGIQKRTDTTGIPSAHVRYVADTGKCLFVATDKTVFMYSDERKTWQPVFAAPASGSISFIKASTDSKGRSWLWVASGKSLFKRDIDSLAKEERSDKEAKNLNERTREPSIIEVHQMAIHYAEVSPEKIRAWRNGARWKALFPKLSLEFSESTDDNVEIYTSSTKSYHYAAPKEIDNGWKIDLTWDLSDLVWNESQTSIDVRSKLMVQLRDEILEEVTRLYFERKRLLIELAKTGNAEKSSDKRLRVEELTAHIDSLTGGKFSKALENSK